MRNAKPPIATGGFAHRILTALFRMRFSPPAERRLRSVEQITLGGKRTVTLIVLDGVEYLVGGSADAIHIIVPIGDR